MATRTGRCRPGIQTSKKVGQLVGSSCLFGIMSESATALTGYIHMRENVARQGLLYNAIQQQKFIHNLTTRKYERFFSAPRMFIMSRCRILQLEEFSFFELSMSLQSQSCCGTKKNKVLFTFLTLDIRPRHFGPHGKVRLVAEKTYRCRSKNNLPKTSTTSPGLSIS